jgi:hypothetical protein
VVGREAHGRKLRAGSVCAPRYGQNTDWECVWRNAEGVGSY